MAQMLSRGPVTGTAAGRGRKRKPFLLDLYSTAVGKKYVMAITGIIGIGFVIGHMVGNLKVYLGVIAEGDERVYDVDIYGEFLRELLVPILPRTVLPVGHAPRAHRRAACCTCTLPTRSRCSTARPARSSTRRPRDYQVANFASRTMRWTGIIVVLFLFCHLADLTWGWFNPDYVRGAPYRNIDASPVATARRGALHRRQHRPRHPPVPRHVVAVPVDGLEQPTVQPVAARPRHRRSPRSIVVGNVSIPIAVQAGIIEFDPRRRHCCAGRRHRRMTHHARLQDPRRTARRQVAELHRQREAGQPGEQAQVQDHRRRHRARRCVGGGDARPSSATRSRRSRSTTRRAAPTRSPPRAASTRRRTTRATATASTACSTTRSRAATSAAARPTCTASPRCRSTSSTRWSPRACRSLASTAACSTTAASAAPRSAARSTPVARPASSC